MNFKKKTLSVLIASSTLALVACGGGGDDQDSGANNSTSFTGLVIDGRIAGGKVWADLNNNNKIDDFEPYAYTDSLGYYSYNPEKNVNYCALPVVSDEYQRYCLIYGSSSDSVVIRVRGGTDLSTGERLKGVMSMSTTVSDSRQISSTPLVLSPITTLLQSADTTSSVTNIRSALGVTSDSDLRLDFSSATDDKSKKFLANSIAVQTMIDTIGSTVTNNDASKQLTVIRNFSSQVASIVPPTSFTETEINTVINSVTTTSTSTLAQRLADLNKEIAKIESAVDQVAINARIKASEVVSQLVKKENTSGTDATSAAKVLDEGITNLATQLTSSSNLGQTTTTNEFDIATITNKLVVEGAKSGFDLDTAVTAAVEKSKLETIEADNIWAGHFLSLSGKEGTEAARVIAFFDGSSTDSQGSASLCYALNAENDDDDQASIVKGRWSKISKNTIQVSTDLGDFQIKAYKQAVIADDPDTEVDELENYLGINDGDGAVDEENVTESTTKYGNFFFSSQAIDKDATWYSDFQSSSDDSATDSEKWGLRATVGTVPTTGTQCKTFDYGSFDNILLTNIGELAEN